MFIEIKYHYKDINISCVKVVETRAIRKHKIILKNDFQEKPHTVDVY